jgi:hypothetical protein
MNNQEILELILSRYIITAGGRYSRGKSLTLTALSFFDIIMNGKRHFLTNMPMNFGAVFPEINDLKYTPLISTSQFDNIPKGCDIVIDELQQDLSARNSSSTANKYITVFGRDVAKLGCHLFGSFQFGDSIDKLIGFSVEIIIIPEYYETYSKNIKEDNTQRAENKDFRMNWIVYDRRDGEQYFISGKNFNLYPIIFMYNTKFKMQKLYVNHKEFTEKLKGQNRELYEMNHSVEISDRITNWNDGLKEIGKINIR